MPNTFQRTKPSHPDDEHFTGVCPTCQQPDLCHRVRELEEAVDRARAEERERCAKLCEEEALQANSEHAITLGFMAKRIREQKP